MPTHPTLQPSQLEGLHSRLKLWFLTTMLITSIPPVFLFYVSRLIASALNNISQQSLVEQHVSHSIFCYLLLFSVRPLSCCIARTYKRMPLAVSYLCPTFLVRYRRLHISNMHQNRFRTLLNQQIMTVFITGAAEHTIPLGNYHAHVLYLKTHFLICSCI